MTIEERLKNAQNKMSELSNKFNSLEREKQECLKEVLRLEGEIRVLQEIK